MNLKRKNVYKAIAKVILKKPHKNLVFRPVDKAANKVAVVCQKFYAQTNSSSTLIIN